MVIIITFDTKKLFSSLKTEVIEAMNNVIKEPPNGNSTQNRLRYRGIRNPNEKEYYLSDYTT